MLIKYLIITLVSYCYVTMYLKIKNIKTAMIVFVCMPAGQKFRNGVAGGPDLEFSQGYNTQGSGFPSSGGLPGTKLLPKWFTM